MELANNVTIDEGVNQYGIHRQITLEGDQAVTKLTYDAEAMIDEAHARRVHTAGDRWNEGQTHVGFIPMAELTRINETYKSAQERKFQILLWLKNNPKLVTFDKFLK